jgi:hypothetical protein
VRRFVRRADELLHVNQLMNQHFIPQSEPRTIHGSIAVGSRQQSRNPHHERRAVLARPNRPKPSRRTGRPKLNSIQWQDAGEQFSIENRRSLV